jgi:hypothetical protein
MSQELRDEKGYYPVGGGGANIQWHTEDDLMDIADKDNLLRDMRMYGASLLRTINAPLHPFDWTCTTADFRATLAKYQDATGDQFDFAPARAALDALEESLQTLYAGTPSGAAADRFNFAQRRLARILVPVNFSRMEPFFHDPALNVPPLPDLAPALSMPSAKNDVARRGVLKAHLTRGQNRLVWALQNAREVVEAAIA